MFAIRFLIFFSLYVSETDAEVSSSMPGDGGPPQAAKRAVMTGEEIIYLCSNSPIYTPYLGVLVVSAFHADLRSVTHTEIVCCVT